MTSLPVAERLAAGKNLRERVPRGAHGVWQVQERGTDLIRQLQASNRGRLPDLIPLRYGRMLQDPFAFLRGAPSVMARDLAQSPVTGIQVQACGDAHLLNFGAFASPERNLVFDINDFDETLPGAWEWDLKRLVASCVVAARVHGFNRDYAEQAVYECVDSYRIHLREYAEMSPLDVWYSHVTADKLIERAPCDESQQQRERMVTKARRRTAENLFPKLTVENDGEFHFVEDPPITHRIVSARHDREVIDGIEQYRQSLAEDRRFLFSRYQLADFARRVVGVGSVGTRCYVALFLCDDRSPLLLQIKEARPSVLEPLTGKGPFRNQGQRVVVGQRLIQATSDILLGWLRSRSGHDYYVRQLRDMKYSVPLERLSPEGFVRYAEICGWTLAGAHARSGDAATISGYLGRGERFALALCQFASAYADQTEADHQALVDAVRRGRIRALTEDDA